MRSLLPAADGYQSYRQAILNGIPDTRSGAIHYRLGGERWLSKTSVCIQKSLKGEEDNKGLGTEVLVAGLHFSL